MQAGALRCPGFFDSQEGGRGAEQTLNRRVPLLSRSVSIRQPLPIPGKQTGDGLNHLAGRVIGIGYQLAGIGQFRRADIFPRYGITHCPVARGRLSRATN